MAVNTKHPQFAAYSDAWDQAAERAETNSETLAYDDRRARDAACLAEFGEFTAAIKLLDSICAR